CARCINVNFAVVDAMNPAGLPLTGDARALLEALEGRLAGWAVAPEYRELASRLQSEWTEEVDRLYHLQHGPLPAQSEVLGAVNELSRPRPVLVCAARSLPAALH